MPKQKPGMDTGDVFLHLLSLDKDPFKETARTLLEKGWTSRKFWDAYTGKKFQGISEPTIVRMFNAIKDLEVFGD